MEIHCPNKKESSNIKGTKLNNIEYSDCQAHENCHKSFEILSSVGNGDKEFENKNTNDKHAKKFDQTPLKEMEVMPLECNGKTKLSSGKDECNTYVKQSVTVEKNLRETMKHFKSEIGKSTGKKERTLRFQNPPRHVFNLAVKVGERKPF